MHTYVLMYAVYRLSETIGEGQFGNVCLGVWTHREESTNVAVKTLRKKARLEDRLKFLREAAIMGQFMHPSIVKMHGVVLRDDPVMIVLELLPRGDLKQYLGELKQKRHSLSQESLQKKFLGFAQQISAGMNYLGNKKFIHRDLAARNILMADEDTCKIGDFGMARDLIHENYYIANGGKIPVKWTSLEALQYQKYSKASDVWSFGVLLYEIWSLGAVPYEGMRALEIIDFLKSGRRLSPPPGCPRAIYELMIQSWHPDAAYRPSFSTYVLSLNNLYEEVVSWSTDQTSAQYQIGRALVLGKSLYRDLQDIYLS
jgi:serine/threonine protein kinase